MEITFGEVSRLLTKVERKDKKRKKELHMRQEIELHLTPTLTCT